MSMQSTNWQTNKFRARAVHVHHDSPAETSMANDFSLGTAAAVSRQQPPRQPYPPTLLIEIPLQIDCPILYRLLHPSPCAEHSKSKELVEFLSKEILKLKTTQNK